MWQDALRVGDTVRDMHESKGCCVAERFEFDAVDVLGVPVHAATMGQALDAVHTAVQEKRQLMIGVVNAAKIVNMSKNKELRDDVLSSDLILADGMSVVVASRVLGVPLPERITGIDLMMGILQRGSEGGYRCYCLGASDEVSQIVAAKIGKLFPGVKLVGRRDGYFKESEEAEVAESIASLNVDVLFVAITSPKKERFMAKWGHKLNATVVHGVGGSFDVLADKVQRAPESWQRSGFEWFYRVKQEPRRLWKRYLVTNIGFTGMLFAAWFRKAGRRGRS